MDALCRLLVKHEEDEEAVFAAASAVPAAQFGVAQKKLRHESVFFYAVQTQNVAAVKALLRAATSTSGEGCEDSSKFDISGLSDEDGCSLLEKAVEAGGLEIVEALLVSCPHDSTSGAASTSTTGAAATGAVDDGTTSGRPLAQNKLQKKYRVDLASEWNAFLAAGAHEDSRILELLLARNGGRPPLESADEGTTPHDHDHEAAESSKSSMVHAFIEEGATPAALASLCRCAAAVGLNGVSPVSGDPPLVSAMRRRQMNLVQVLVDCQADVCATAEKTGDTALHVAVAMNVASPGVLELLKAAKQVKNAAGKTPEDLMREKQKLVVGAQKANYTSAAYAEEKRREEQRKEHAKLARAATRREKRLGEQKQTAAKSDLAAWLHRNGLGSLTDRLYQSKHFSDLEVLLATEFFSKEPEESRENTPPARKELRKLLSKAEEEELLAAIEEEWDRREKLAEEEAERERRERRELTPAEKRKVQIIGVVVVVCFFVGLYVWLEYFEGVGAEKVVPEKYYRKAAEERNEWKGKEYTDGTNTRQKQKERKRKSRKSSATASGSSSSDEL